MYLDYILQLPTKPCKPTKPHPLCYHSFAFRLDKHVELLPKEIRENVVQEAIRGERRQFCRRMEKYRNDMIVYEAQMRIEVLRIKLMQDAGIISMPGLGGRSPAGSLSMD